MPTDVVIEQLPDTSDVRGMSFSLPSTTLARLTIRDAHLAAIGPGHVRGNHYHTEKIELITVIYNDDWSLHWDTGEGTPVQSRTFSGSGAVTVEFPFLWAHAVKNDGKQDLWMINLNDRAFDPTEPDADQDAPPRKIA
jgi:oxalate decarboxylase/phosphoglucose isomerase-like protein (cupin superfamily)